MESLILYLIISGRINFRQMGRYGSFCKQQRFHQNFSKDSDWLEFNLSLSERILSGNRKVMAIDPSFIPKSEKETPWIGYFWSGKAGQAKRGLEILRVGLIDIDNKNCISLKTAQILDSQTLESNEVNLVDCGFVALKFEKEKLQSSSHYVVADIYFFKSRFVMGLKEVEFHLVSLFRDDVVLFYPILEKPTGKKVRFTLYDGKIDMASFDKSRVHKINIDNGEPCTVVAYFIYLKQKVRFLIRYSKGGKKLKPYFSSYSNMSDTDVIECHCTRFQIEFCFCNAKSFIELMRFQAVDIARLSFNFNASLTSVSLVKVLAEKRSIHFSASSCMTMIHDAQLLERFICVSGIKPNRRLNDKLVKGLAEFVAIAA